MPGVLKLIPDLGVDLGLRFISDLDLAMDFPFYSPSYIQPSSRLYMNSTRFRTQQLNLSRAARGPFEPQHAQHPLQSSRQYTSISTVPRVKDLRAMNATGILSLPLANARARLVFALH